MFTPNLRGIAGPQLLAFVSYLSGLSLAPSETYGQDRIFGLFSHLNNYFDAKLAVDQDSTVARRFIREVDLEGDLRAQFSASLNDRTALQIRSRDFNRVESPTGCEITLGDGSCIKIASTDIPELKITRDSRIELNNLTIPTSAISHIRLSPSAKYDLDWQKVAADGSKTEDLLVIRRSNGKLDTLGGVVRFISSDLIEFKVDDEIYRVPHAKIEGLILANLHKPDARAAPKASLETKHHFLRYSKITVSEAEDLLHIETPAGAIVTIPLIETMLIDRTRELAITLEDMKITALRTANFSEYSTALPLYDRPLTLSQKAYSISGSGPDTSLTVNGGVSLEVEVPHGEYSLYFSPKFDKYSPMSFTITYDTGDPRASFQYTQKRFSSAEEVLNIRNELESIGPGKLTIIGGTTGEEIRFNPFILFKK